MSRSRSWRAISSAASRLLLKTVSSRLEVPDVLARVHVDDRERLGVLDDERPARGQPDLAVQRLVELLVDVVLLEEREPLGRGVVELDAVGQLGVEGAHVVPDLGVELGIVDDDAPVVGVELLPDDPHGQPGLPVEERRRADLLGLGADGLPLAGQAQHVGPQLLLAHALGRRAHDQAVLVGLHPIQDRPQPPPLVVGQPLGDAVGLRVGDQHDEPAGQRHLLGEAGALGPDRVLGDLRDDELLVLEELLDAGAVGAPRPVLGRLQQVLGVVLDVPAVEDRVLGRPDVHEGRFHPRQHVLDPPDVDVAVDLGHVVGRAG